MGEHTVPDARHAYLQQELSRTRTLHQFKDQNLRGTECRIPGLSDPECEIGIVRFAVVCGAKLVESCSITLLLDALFLQIIRGGGFRRGNGLRLGEKRMLLWWLLQRSVCGHSLLELIELLPHCAQLVDHLLLELNQSSKDRANVMSRCRVHSTVHCSRSQSAVYCNRGRIYSSAVHGEARQLWPCWQTTHAAQ